jgi:hypothetical protein
VAPERELTPLLLPFGDSGTPHALFQRFDHGQRIGGEHRGSPASGSPGPRPSLSAPLSGRSPMEDRAPTDALEFMRDVASRLDNRVQLTTDGLNSYIVASGPCVRGRD